MSRAKLPLEDFVRLPSFYAPRVNHAGDQVAFYANHTGRMELYRIVLPDGAKEQVSDGQLPRSLHAGYTWLRDGSGVVFARDNDGDEQHDLWVLDFASRTARQLTATPRAEEHPIEVSPDGRTVLMASNRAGQMNAWLVDLADGEARPLTGFAQPVWPGLWSPDGDWIALSASVETDLRNRDGYLVRADGSELRRVFRTAIGVRDSLVDWHPGGRILSVNSEVDDLPRVGLLDLDSGAVRWLGEGSGEETGGRFSRSGEWLLATRNKDASPRPVLYHAETGEERPLRLPPGDSYGVDFALDDRALVMAVTASNRRSELLLYDLAADRTSVLVPAEYGSIDPNVFVTPSYVSYPSRDGRAIPAVLTTPRDRRPGERLPAVVVVHGGPAGQWLMGFNPYFQILADRGYVVLGPNPRGSSGYGKVFRELNIGDWGGMDLEDIAAGAEFLRSLDYVDPDRLAVFGGSYGGYMTYLQLVRKPQLWKVGVAWVGITDLLLMYEESMQHFRHFLRMYLGDPVEQAELWRDRSPITHAEHLRAKLLMVHGVNDPRCPVSQARVFRDRLRELGRVEGVDFEYVELTEEGHGSTDQDQQLRTYRLLLDYLDRWL